MLCEKIKLSLQSSPDLSLNQICCHEDLASPFFSFVYVFILFKQYQVFKQKNRGRRN